MRTNDKHVKHRAQWPALPPMITNALWHQPSSVPNTTGLHEHRVFSAICSYWEHVDAWYGALSWAFPFFFHMFLASSYHCIQSDSYCLLFLHLAGIKTKMGGPRIESEFCYLWNHRNKKKLKKKKSETEIGLEKQKAVKLFNSVSLVCSSSKDPNCHPVWKCQNTKGMLQQEPRLQVINKHIYRLSNSHRPSEMSERAQCS